MFNKYKDIGGDDDNKILKQYKQEQKFKQDMERRMKDGYLDFSYNNYRNKDDSINDEFEDVSDIDEYLEEIENVETEYENK
jgi:hypothetical protein